MKIRGFLDKMQQSENKFILNKRHLPAHVMCLWYTILKRDAKYQQMSEFVERACSDQFPPLVAVLRASSGRVWAAEQVYCSVLLS